MVQPIDYNTEFFGQFAFTSIFSKPNFIKNLFIKILKEEGITNPNLDQWYKVKPLINFYHRVEKEYGTNTIFELGKFAADQALIPKGLETLELFLENIESIYTMNHRNGYVGYIKCLSHDSTTKQIIIESYVPYLNEGIRGFLISFIRLYKKGVVITRNEALSVIINGIERNHYIISYR